jgi:hypothetical protein
MKTYNVYEINIHKRWTKDVTILETKFCETTILHFLRGHLKYIQNQGNENDTRYRKFHFLYTIILEDHLKKYMFEHLTTYM